MIVDVVVRSSSVFIHLCTEGITDDINLTNIDADKMVAELGPQNGKPSAPFK